MLRGYVRVSSVDQNPERQIVQLEAASCDVIYQEKVSGATLDRPELQRLLGDLQAGDVVLVVDLTRISRSTQDLFKLVDDIKEKGASLKSIKDTWLDTSSDNPYSTFLLTVMAGVSQLERDLIKQRQAEGVQNAKKAGKYKGRPKKYSEKHVGMKHAIELYKTGQYTVKQICEITKVSRASLYVALKQEA